MRNKDDRASFHLIDAFLSHTEKNGFGVILFQDITHKVLKTRRFFHEAMAVYGREVLKHYDRNIIAEFIKTWNLHDSMYEQGIIGYYLMMLKHAG